MLIICRDTDLALKKVALQCDLASPDTIVLSTTGPSLGIDEVRRLRRSLSLRPLHKTHKTAVILEAEKLTIEGQNALLKILEEPPADAAIILVARDQDLLLPTVISRCQITFVTSPPAKLSSDEKTQAEKILNLIKEKNLAAGFAWAKEAGSKRDDALAAIDQLLIACHDNIVPFVVRQLLKAKKYLRASTNVRLTLENLFLG